MPCFASASTQAKHYSNNDEVLEAIRDACAWAEIALDKALAEELGGIACAMGIASAVQGCLTRKLLEPADTGSI